MDSTIDTAAYTTEDRPVSELVSKDTVLRDGKLWRVVYTRSMATGETEVLLRHVRYGDDAIVLDSDATLPTVVSGFAARPTFERYVREAVRWALR